MGVFLLASLFFKKKKFFIWTHGWYGKESIIEAKMKLWLFHSVSGIFVYGDRAKHLIIDQGVPEEKLFVIHNSLQYNKHILLRKTLRPSNIYEEHFGNKYPVLLIIGRLNLRKKINQLFEAVAELKNRGENYNIILIGNGEDREALEILSSNLNLNHNVWFYGACYDEKENARLILNADLCVVPGDIGLTAIHVMTFGIPVITHDTFETQGPEYEVVRDGITGAFFKRDDVIDLANKISLWFKKNAEKRDEVRNACYNEIDSQWTPNFQITVLKNNLKF